MINVYVDGSYNQKTDKVGWAWIQVSGSKIINSKNGELPNKFNANQVMGELYAVMNFINHLDKEQVMIPWLHEITFYYDYHGIKKWITGEWKANKEVSQQYKKYMNLMIEKGYRIKFKKVKSHSGNYWNNKVDKLAKKGCNL